MTTVKELHDAIIRAVEEAGPDGLPDEDVHDAVSYFVEASEYDVQHAVGVLFDADVIGRSTSRENWRLA